MKTIKFKKLNDKAVTPKRATDGACGFDLVATSRTYQGGCYVYSTGIAVEIPKDKAILIIPRSSIYKTGLILSNSAGLIDSDYRGEIKFMFRPVNDHPMLYAVGDRIGQMIIIDSPSYCFKESKELSNTKRGSGGFGSTGK